MSDCIDGVAESTVTPELTAFLASVEYFIFAAVIVAAYVLVAGISWRETWKNLRRPDGKGMRANNAQVAVIIGTGATVRAGYYCVQFLAESWTREVLLAVSQVAWVAAFVLIVMYWMEMQTTMERIHSVSSYRPQLLITLAVYSVGRALQGVCRHLCGDVWKLVTLGLTCLVYLFYVLLFAFAAFWSWRLWRRMVRMNAQVRSRTQAAFLQRKLRKLTRIIVMEVVSAAILMGAGLLRWMLRAQDPEMRTKNPSTYLLVGLPEYLMEYALVIVLCLAIVVSKSRDRKFPPSSSSSEASRAAARRSTVVKASPLIAAGKPGGPKRAGRRASGARAAPGASRPGNRHSAVAVPAPIPEREGSDEDVVDPSSIALRSAASAPGELAPV